MVEDGYFSVYIGEAEPLDLTLFRDNGNIYVGIQVDTNTELAPRVTMGTAPYAAYGAPKPGVPAQSALQDALEAVRLEAVSKDVHHHFVTAGIE